MLIIFNKVKCMYSLFLFLYIYSNKKRNNMKKIIFLLPFLMLASLFSMGQNIKHVSLNFSMDYFKTQRDDAGNTYVLSDNLNYFLKSDTLLPALPYIGYNVLIGSTEKYDSHTIRPQYSASGRLKRYRRI